MLKSGCIGHRYGSPGQAEAAQQAQLENLVKIYEIMKPKEAAKIFETLDMPILPGVVQKMKPARDSGGFG